MTGSTVLLALNVGSSSLKFRVATGAAAPVALVGAVDRVGSDAAALVLTFADGRKEKIALGAADHQRAFTAVADAVAKHLPGAEVAGIGHRIVHGGDRFTQPVEVSAEILSDLDDLSDLAPLHQPYGVDGIRFATGVFPSARQIACFDTAFHAGKPWIHDAFALPRAQYDKGLRRYGFHGLSCQSVVRGLTGTGYPVADRKLVIAHLGNGCSVTAVDEGKGTACSMGFSTLDGLVMGTRSGRMDPGVLLHLLRSGMSRQELEDLLYRQSGLLGLSGISNDMRDLESAGSPEAEQSIAFFVARLVEEICRMAGVLHGLDAVVFCGGIGENADSIRNRVREGLSFLPGSDGNGVEIIVQQTDEEAELLQAVESFLP